MVNGLRDAGLSTYEAQSYLALIRNPNVSATQLCNEAGIPDSKIYFALEELQKKGLVVVSEGVPRHYRALDPKRALAKLKASIATDYEDRLEKLGQLATALEPLYSHVQRKDVELAYVVKGFDNVLGRMVEALKGAKREVIVFIPTIDIYDKLEPTLLNLARNKVRTRLAVRHDMRRAIERDRYSEVREMSTYCRDSWLAVIDGKSAITSSAWATDRCYAILTQDPVLVAMSSEYYESPRCCLTG